MTRQEIQTDNEPDTTEDKVGYKRPPVKSQFRKGRSGNPRGRRKGQRNLGPVLAEVLRQTVTVKQEGKSRRMSKGEALIRILLTKANKGDSSATKAVLELSEKIGRIQSAELKLGGRGNYEFMLIPGMASSAEEWQREIANRDQAAALRESVAAFRARTGTFPTYSQIGVLRQSLAAGRVKDTRPGTRRPVNRIAKSSLKPDPTLGQSNSEAAASAPMPTAEATPPQVQRSPTGTYRKVNRQQPGSPTHVPKA